MRFPCVLKLVNFLFCHMKDFQLVLTTEVEFLVNAIHKQDQDNSLLYPRLLICLQQTEVSNWSFHVYSEVRLLSNIILVQPS